MTPDQLRTVFMGTPEFALPTLQGLIDAGVDLVGVFTQPDRPKGRGKKLAAPPVKELAQQHQLAVFQPQKLRDPAVVEQLRELRPDLVVVVAYGQILPKSLLEIPAHGCINVHASLLPRYRGAAPINQAVIDGQTETGVTTMYMDVGLDTGDTLIKRTLSIGPDETAGQLHDRLAVLGRVAMDETLQHLCAGTLSAEPQDDSLTSYAPMLKKEDGQIDWQQTAEQVHNRIRGLDPWPGAYTFLDGQQFKVAASRYAPGLKGSPGEILAADKSGVQVACGEGGVVLSELQLPGKKRLRVIDFLSGHPLYAGTILG